MGERMQVIICDDEKSTCTELEQLLLNYASERGVKLQSDVFYSGDSLTKYLSQGNTLDILFLDIQLPGINGITVGDYIRTTLENEQIFIIYISSNQQYAMELFQNRPFDFLIKPLNRERIFCILDKIFRITGKNNCIFQYQSNGIIYRIHYREILYFQSIGRKIYIITTKERKSFYGKLKDIENKLPEHLFLNIHKSYIINFNYVKEYTYERITMINGDILNISKSNRTLVRGKVLEREIDEFRNY